MRRLYFSIDWNLLPFFDSKYSAISISPLESETNNSVEQIGEKDKKGITRRMKSNVDKFLYSRMKSKLKHKRKELYLELRGLREKGCRPQFVDDHDIWNR